MSSLPFSIHLNSSGVYLLNREGSAGKSYLCKLINAYRISNPDYKAISYIPKRSNEDIVQEIENFNGDVLVLDRLDLYNSPEIMSAVKDKDIKVLVDIKDCTICNDIYFKFADIKRSKDVLVVEEI